MSNLPQLPKGDVAADTCPVMWVHSHLQMWSYAEAAILGVTRYQKISDSPPPKEGHFLGLNISEQVPEVWSGDMYWECLKPTAPANFPRDDAKQLTHWAQLLPLPKG